MGKLIKISFRPCFPVVDRELWVVSKITLSRREREYVLQKLELHSLENGGESEGSPHEQTEYDLNYRLKKKFEQMHADYWLLVRFFKAFEKSFNLRTTERTKMVLDLAKSQIQSSETVVNARCHFCLRSDGVRLIDLNICEDCMQEFSP